MIDQLAKNIANEAKTGYQSLTKDILLQIDKDVELIQNAKVAGVIWHFFRSRITGLVGPSGPLERVLTSNGIIVIIHL